MYLCKVMVRKLKSEQYLRVEITDEEYSQSKIGGFSGYDINLSNNIDKSRISVVTGKDGEEISNIYISTTNNKFKFISF